MFYIYILESKKDKNLYIGSTRNLKQRVQEHNKGKNKSTKSRIPYKLIFYESYINKKDALKREKYLKTTKGHTTIKSKLREYLIKK